MSHIDQGKKLSVLVDRFVPAYIRENHSQYVEFIKKYFEFLEQDLGYYDIITHLLDYGDIDNTVDAFLNEYKLQYDPNIPESLASNLKLVLKNIRSFYKSKGTEKSYEFLFKSIFNTFVTFYYPKIDILRASAGKWIEPLFLVVTPDDTATLTSFIDKRIVGGTTNSEAYVEKTVVVTYNGGPRTALSLLDITGQFQAGETITIKDVGTPIVNIETTPSGVIVGSGRWEGTDGFVSWDKKLQDNLFYQEFSYVLRTDISIDFYKKIIEENVHPAGFKFFGEVTVADYLPVNLDNLTTVVFWIIAWLEVSILNLTHSGDEFINELRYNQKQGHLNYDWSHFETNREDRPMVNLFPEIGYFDEVIIRDFQTHKSKHSCILSLDGIKIDYNDYDIRNNTIIFNSTPIVGTLSVHYLNNPQYHPERFIGDNSINIWTLGYSPVGGPNALLVYVNGVKLEKITDYFITAGNQLNLVTTPATNDIVEVIYLEDDNYLGLNTNLFVGDANQKIFTLTQNVDRQRHYNTIVSIDGVKLIPREEYTIQNGTLVLDQHDIIAPGIGASIEVVFMKHTDIRNEFFPSDGIKTQYGIERIPDTFDLIPTAYLQILP